MKKCPGCKKEVTPGSDGKCPECGYQMVKATEEEIEPLEEGAIIDGDDLAPVIESAQAIVPKKGKLFEERQLPSGITVKVAKFAIIRPCQSKGRRIRGHAPIYEARMLAENAQVFTGWPMYFDHMDEQLAEEIVELLQERGRSMKDLGGRILKSFYDPELVLEGDDEKGYRKGGVVSEVVPQKTVREMLEEDPECLECSINAWPKGVKIGTASWDPKIKGALIEGIRSKPMGSVDFVFAGGAGGRPLTEAERSSAVSLLESCLTSERDEDPDPEERKVKVKKLSEMNSEEVAKLTPEQLQESLKAENPSLAESIAPPAPSGGDENGGITREDLDRALSEQREAITSEFKDAQLSEEQVEDRANEIVQEREELRSLADCATEYLAELQANGLPNEYVKEIAKNYLLLPSGPRAGLLVEEREEDGETLSKEAVLKESIKADAQTAVKLIEAAGGKPRVKGLGPTKPDENGNEGGEGLNLREGNAFLDFLAESGDLTGDAEKDKKKLSEMVEEGV